MKNIYDTSVLSEQDEVVEMPKEGTWFPVASVLRQHCCGCGLIHFWEFRLVDGQIEIRISSEK